MEHHLEFVTISIEITSKCWTKRSQL